MKVQWGIDLRYLFVIAVALLKDCNIPFMIQAQEFSYVTFDAAYYGPCKPLDQLKLKERGNRSHFLRNRVTSELCKGRKCMKKERESGTFFFWSVNLSAAKSNNRDIRYSDGNSKIQEVLTLMWKVNSSKSLIPQYEIIQRALNRGLRSAIVSVHNKVYATQGFCMCCGR